MVFLSITGLWKNSDVQDRKWNLKKLMIYESIHAKSKAQMLEFESWNMKACAAAKD